LACCFSESRPYGHNKNDRMPIALNRNDLECLLVLSPHTRITGGSLNCWQNQAKSVRGTFGEREEKAVQKDNEKIDTIVQAAISVLTQSVAGTTKTNMALFMSYIRLQGRPL
jgi:hypothetical protein